MLDLEKYKEIKRVLKNTLILNLIIAIIKIGYGLWFKLISMTADGFHSLLDSSSNIVGFIGIRMAFKPPDVIHPYGHRKFETFASLGISLLLFLACYRIAEEAFQRLSNSVQPETNLIAFIIIITRLSKKSFLTNDKCFKIKDFLEKWSQLVAYPQWKQKSRKGLFCKPLGDDLNLSREKILKL